jgi:hypothetical protein
MFEKYSGIKFNENPSSGVLPCRGGGELDDSLRLGVIEITRVA